MSWSSCFLMHPHACLPCEQRLHFRGMSWKFSLCSQGNACCAYAHKNFSCVISIINRIIAYVYYLLQNLLVHWRFLIEFKKYEDERTTILLTNIQSCPLLTSYICHNFRHQQRTDSTCYYRSTHCLIPMQFLEFSLIVTVHFEPSIPLCLCIFKAYPWSLLHNNYEKFQEMPGYEAAGLFACVQWPTQPMIFCVWYEINHS